MRKSFVNTRLRYTTEKMKKVAGQAAKDILDPVQWQKYYELKEAVRILNSDPQTAYNGVPIGSFALENLRRLRAQHEREIHKWRFGLRMQRISESRLVFDDLYPSIKRRLGFRVEQMMDENKEHTFTPTDDPKKYMTVNHDTLSFRHLSVTVIAAPYLGLPQSIHISGKATLSWLKLKPEPHDEYLIHRCAVKYVTRKTSNLKCRVGFIVKDRESGNVAFDEDMDSAIVRMNKAVTRKVVKAITS